MSNIILIIGIVLIELWALYVYEDLLSPPCIVCESFILAFICGCLSSALGGWNFKIHYNTVVIIVSGLLFFVIGSFFAKGYKINYRKSDSEVKYIEISKRKCITMLFIQAFLLLLYMYYYKRTIAQFGSMDWGSMIRMYRFVGAYGEGFKTTIPGWVSQLIKLSRANAYISLYALMHNIAIRKIVKGKMLNNIWYFLIIVLYLPYNILNAARFELLVILSMAIIIWYTYFRKVGQLTNRVHQNDRIAIGKIGLIIVLAMVAFSLLAPLVGRIKSEGVISQSADYFGRTIQAFDVFIQSRTEMHLFNDSESFYNISKLLRQFHIINDSGAKFYLDFANQDGYSLGNTYTALRRYYADFGIVGVIVLAFIGGFIFSYLYRKTISPKIGSVDFSFMLYAAVSFCTVLYCYEEFTFSTILSLNYLIIFLFLYVVNKWTNNDMSKMNT